MAHIPAIPISERGIRTAPETVSFGPTRSNLGHELSRFAQAAGRAGHEMFHGILRGNERRRAFAERAAHEAERADAAHERQVRREAAAVHADWAVHMRRGINGYAYVDENGEERRVEGIRDRTWQHYEGTDESPVTDLGKLEEAWRESDAFKNMNPEVRAEFDRMSQADRQTFAEGVGRIYDRNFQARQVVLKERADANDYDRVLAAADADDAVYAATAADAAARITAREMAPVIKNVEVLDQPGFNASMLEFRSDAEREGFNQVVRERLFGDKGMAFQRITYLTQAGAHGKPTAGGLKPAEALDAADRWIKFLEADGEAAKDDPNRPHLSETQAKKLRAIVRDARAKYSDLMDTAARKWAEDVEAQNLANIALPVEGDARDAARYHAQRSQMYEQILASEQGMGLAKHAPAKFKAFQNMAVREGDAAVSALRKANGERFVTMLEDGFIGDHQITPAEIQATADELMAAKAITQDAYDKAKRAKAKALTPSAKALHERIFAGKNAKFPAMCRWQESVGLFAIPETKEGRKVADEKMALVREKHWYGDDKEHMLFRDYVAAANYAIDYMLTKNCTVDQAFAEFQSLTLNTEKELASLAYDQRLERRKEALDALRRRTSARSSSFARKVTE